MRRIVIAALAIALAAVLPPAVSAAERLPIATAQETFSPQLVRFTPTTNAAAQAAVFKRAGARVKFVYDAVFSGLAASLTSRQIASLEKMAHVVSVEPDIVMTVVGTQNKPVWGLDRIDQQTSRLDEKYSYGNSAQGITAYILDTGVSSTHSEFTGRLVSGFTAFSDGKGTNDCYGHGTHVAGTVGGTNFGVAKEVSLVPVRVLDCNGSGTVSGIVAGLNWVITNHQAGIPAVANMSLGGGASNTLDAAVVSTINDGVAVVVAAGNSAADACKSSPARVPAALTIGATGQSDARASFSNFGTCLDLFAPGVEITSAGIASSTASVVLSGTSMAAPHVAGVAALLLANSPSLSPDQLSVGLKAVATPGVVTSAGAGSPNLLIYADSKWASSSSIPTPTPTPTATATSSPSPSPTPTATLAPPGTPTGVTATKSSKNSILVTWVAPSSGGAVATYEVELWVSGAMSPTTVAVGISSSARSVNFKGLKIGREYYAKVRARNASGTATSDSSNTVLL